jgi:prephenate dehydratase
MKNYKIAFQGLRGTYSEQAIVNYGKKHRINFEVEPTKNFRNLFETIDKKTFLGIVPIENSTAGSVTECYDLFLEYEFEIIGEYNLKVNHCLLGKKGVKIEELKEVYSHPQALAQCSNFLEKIGVIPVSYLDTAGSAYFVSKSSRKDIASISSEIAAKIFGLEILKRNFQNSLNNYTRFLIVKKKGKNFEFEKKLPKPNKSTVIFETKNIPAALYKCLGGFATNNVNLTKIESRPIKNGEFKYIFYLDFDGNIEEKNVKLALEELKFFSKEIRFLGSYKKG